ncbi:hypothetical protein SH139x_002225 [Planctomycetaceae bacterium SH139]
MAGQKGRSGRLPKPTEQHVLDGTYRSDRHARRADVLVMAEQLQCPESLTGAAREAWERITLALPDDMLSRLDVDALWLYCQSWAQLLKVWPMFEDNPLDKDARITAMALCTEVDKLGRQFGWSPLSRASLRVPQREEADDPLTELMRRKAERSA